MARGDTTLAARKRPSASASSTCSIPTTGRTRDLRMAMASSCGSRSLSRTKQSSMSLAIMPLQPDCGDHEIGDAADIVEVEHGQPRAFAGRTIRRDRHDLRARSPQRLARSSAVAANFDLGKTLALIALDEHEIAWAGITENIRKRHFRSVADLAHQGEASRRRKRDLASAGLAHPERVAAFMVDLETGMGVLDDGDGEAASRQFGDEADHQGGFA